MQTKPKKVNIVILISDKTEAKSITKLQGHDIDKNYFICKL